MGYKPLLILYVFVFINKNKCILCLPDRPGDLNFQNLIGKEFKIYIRILSRTE
jgi:hypothetical protein